MLYYKLMMTGYMIRSAVWCGCVIVRCLFMLIWDGALVARCYLYLPRCTYTVLVQCASAVY